MIPKRAPSKSGYRVDVLTPKGELTGRTFSNNPEQKGIVDGIAAAVDPLSGSDVLDFKGQVNMLALEPAAVLQAWVKDKAGIIYPAHYGALLPNDATADADGVIGYQSNSRSLFVATACAGERYRNMDTALIALDLATKHRHASLKVRTSDFPLSGTVLDDFTASGQLGEVLDELIQATENADYGCGIDPSGQVFFKPNSLVLEVLYAETGYEDMPVSDAAISTATRWAFFTEPTVKPWSGAYIPRRFIHLSVPDAALHDKYGYVTHRDVPDFVFQVVPDADFTQSGFTNAGNAVAMTPTTPAVRGSGSGVFTLTNDDPLVFGVRFLYRTSEDAGVVRLRASCGVLYDVELPNTKGELQAIDLKLPPHEGTFAPWSSFRLTAAAGGTMELHTAHLLRLNTAQLDAITPVSVPERTPGQIVREGIWPNAARIKLLDAPRGTREVASAGVRYVWTPDDKEGGKAETFTDLEVSAFGEEGRTQKVSGYYRKPS